MSDRGEIVLLHVRWALSLFHIYNQISEISRESSSRFFKQNYISLYSGDVNAIDRRALSIPFEEEDSRNIPRFLRASETQNYISRVLATSESSTWLAARSARVRNLGDISREFPGIPPITLPISALTRPFLRFREDDIREESDKMGNARKRGTFI